MANRFNNTKSDSAAFINLYEGKDKVTNLDELSKLADDIEAGTVKVECFLNKQGEPVLMIKR